MNPNSSEINSGERGAAGPAPLAKVSSEADTGGMQTKVENRGGIKGDGKKGSGEDVPPAKTPKTVKAIKQPRFYETYLVPGINTEKYHYEVGDDNEV